MPTFLERGTVYCHTCGMSFRVLENKFDSIEWGRCGHCGKRQGSSTAKKGALLASAYVWRGDAFFYSELRPLQPRRTA